MSDGVRLQKYLAQAGVSSRRHAEGLIAEGRVVVNGQKVTEPGTKVDPRKDLVVLDGQPVVPSTERRWYLLYKPEGVVTTLSDPQGRATVAEFLGGLPTRVFPVGRLDYDAEGALLFTDDGDTANRLMHPRHGVPRTYLAKVKGSPSDASLEKLCTGVRLEDGLARAARATRFEEAERNTWLRLVVTEGRPHLVKRLCAAIGHPVLRLFRPSHAGIGLEGLRPGQLRALTNDEIRRVKSAAETGTVPEGTVKLPARRHRAEGALEAQGPDEVSPRDALRGPARGAGPAQAGRPPPAAGRRPGPARKSGPSFPGLAWDARGDSQHRPPGRRPEGRGGEESGGDRRGPPGRRPPGRGGEGFGARPPRREGDEARGERRGPPGRRPPGRGGEGFGFRPPRREGEEGRGERRGPPGRRPPGRGGEGFGFKPPRREGDEARGEGRGPPGRRASGGSGPRDGRFSGKRSGGPPRPDRAGPRRGAAPPKRPKRHRRAW